MKQIKYEILEDRAENKADNRADNRIIVYEYDSFDIEQILECGQCFRFERLDKGYYKIIARGKILNIKQGDQIEFFPCGRDDFENIWIDYFDLKRDYAGIKESLYENDIVLRDAIEYAPGIRILRQEPWETLVSFIISQNNRIPQIKKVIQNISRAYGTQIDSENYTFPSPEQLFETNIDGLMSCKTGFRAKYILDAAERQHNGLIDMSRTNSLNTKELKDSLIKIKGVGEKVADCVLLFGFGRYEYFPVDVWVKRIMQYFYFGGNDVPVREIHRLAYEKFGVLAGFAQQYLFHYARQFPEIFKKM